MLTPEYIIPQSLFDVDFYFFVINNPFVNNWNINESYTH